MSQAFPDREQNPYAAPLYAEVLPETPDEDAETSDLRAFVGRNARYYLQKWAPARDHGGSAGFNWAAFLFCGIWLPYRKMYGNAAILYGVILLESLIELVIFSGLLKMETPAGLDTVVNLVISLICGGWGNKWYLSHATRVIADVRRPDRGGDEYSRRSEITRRGGTSLLMGFVVFLVFCVVVGVLLVVLESVLLDEAAPLEGF